MFMEWSSTMLAEKHRATMVVAVRSTTMTTVLGVSVLEVSLVCAVKAQDSGATLVSQFSV